MSTPTPISAGIHHLGLTVPNLRAARDFFVEALGFQLVAEKPDYPAAFVSDGVVMLTLWQAQSTAPVDFDRKTNIGLHHFALALHPELRLEDVYEQIERRADVEIEFAPEDLGQGPVKHMMCTIPGGIRMEIIAAKS